MNKFFAVFKSMRTLFFAAVAIACCLAEIANAAITRPANGVLSGATAGAGATSLTIAQPTGATTGDLLIAQIAVRGGTSTTITPPTGWITILTTSSGTTLRQGLYYRIVLSTDPPAGGYKFNFSSSQRAAGGIVTYRGVDPTNPIDASSSASNTGTLSITIPAATTVSNNTQVMAFFSAANGGTTVTSVDYGTSSNAITYNELYDINTTAGTAGAEVQVSEITPIQAAPGSTDSIIVSIGTAAAHVGVIMALRPSSTINHFVVSHSGSGVNCQAENITFTAHDANHVPISMSGGTVISISTSTNHGSWSLITGAGSFVNGTNGAATYTSGAETSFTLALRDTFAETVNIAVSGGGITEASGTASAEAAPGADPSMTFTSAGFRFVDGSGAVISTQVAGKPSAAFFLQAISSSGCSTPGVCTGACTGTFASGSSASIQLASQCINPSTCQAGQQVSITNNATSSNIQANNAAAAISYTTRNLLFGANSQAALTMTYPDVGQIRLHAQFALDATNTMTGASNTFVVRPFGFNIGLTGNPTATDATGAVFKKAGQTFSATVTAVSWQSADDANNDGIPDSSANLSDNTATPNFNKETAPETVAITSTLVAPSGGAVGAISGGSGVTSFSNGAAAATLSYSEVGIITLNASLTSGSYLSSGVNVTGVTGNVGRFTPDHFAFSSATLTNRSDTSISCADTFTYMDEPFRLDYTITAQNAANGTTQNYTGTFAKLTPTSIAAMGYGAISGTTNLTSRLAGSGTATGSFSNGVATVAAPLTISRAAAPDGPFANLNVGIAPSDTDGIQLSTSALNMDVDNNATNDHARIGITAARFGRLLLANAYGSELLDLPLRMSPQFWNGTGFANMGATDTCTVFNTSDIALSFPVFSANHLTACETTVSLTGGLPINFKLTKPGSGNDGWATVQVNLGPTAPGNNTCTSTTATPATAANKSYLRGNWGTSTFNQDPTALARFGSYRSGSGFIYFRENY